MSRDLSDVELAELARIRALASRVTLAEADLYGAVLEGQRPPEGSGRPRLTWPAMAEAAEVPTSTLQDRAGAWKRRRDERAAERTSA